MTFRPDFSLAVGTVSPEDWRAALVGLRVDLDAGALANACTLTVAVEQAPSVAAGDPVQVDLGGDGALSTVFTGTVDGLEPGLTELRIHTLDDGAKLLALR